ncbi:SOS response-associated peptidase [Amycolatopsis sp. PS_44_ISF1]|uniref:SOS response-associated peptidase n=1 Tax=Amycolatopsis sp. PS_44_ISF1 TaxID=2974917 RepID=UPI0028DD82AD|nr:SOS response-associated peptidase [Amycolatopsis sp. PS_44_ISF1]MDT8911564.1 SOS response-associated peptidase [Amycolatopsis sp. PS_44_ISF1]
MCGRYAATKDPAVLIEEFAAVDLTGDRARADHNVAPTKNVVTVVQRHPRDAEGQVLEDEPAERSLRIMRWGLVPFWAKDPSAGSRMINTRSETAREKPAFKRALASRRCLVPADGWFEWRRTGQEKEPFYMTDPAGASIAFGGIWESWRPKDDAAAEPLITFSIITTDAAGQLTDVHHRMPLIVPSGHWADWLDPDREDVDGLMVPTPPSIVESLELRPVSSLVNNVRNNGPELLERAEAGAQPLDDGLFELS